jgi:hypothetical protein
MIEGQLHEAPEGNNASCSRDLLTDDLIERHLGTLNVWHHEVKVALKRFFFRSHPSAFILRGLSTAPSLPAGDFACVDIDLAVVAPLHGGDLEWTKVVTCDGASLGGNAGARREFHDHADL